MLHLRLPSVGLLALLLLHHTAVILAVDIVLHQQGSVVPVPENGTAAVVCDVYHSREQHIVATFTWNGNPLQSGHPLLVSGLFNVFHHDCFPRNEGQVCAQFILTIKGLSIVNDSTVGCYSRDFSTWPWETTVAVGHVQIMLAPAPTPATQSVVPSASTQSPAPTVTITVHPSPIISVPMTSVLVTTTTTTTATSALSGFPTPLPTPNAGSTALTQGVVSVLLASLVSVLLASLVAARLQILHC